MKNQYSMTISRLANGFIRPFQSQALRRHGPKFAKVKRAREGIREAPNDCNYV